MWIGRLPFQKNYPAKKSIITATTQRAFLVPQFTLKLTHAQAVLKLT